MLKDIDSNPDTITIMTDRFSTYAIAYQGGDYELASNPKTGRDVAVGRIAILISCTALYIAVVSVKKKKGNKVM